MAEAWHMPPWELAGAKGPDAFIWMKRAEAWNRAKVKRAKRQAKIEGYKHGR